MVDPITNLIRGIKFFMNMQYRFYFELAFSSVISIKFTFDK